jgi:2-polyprenyl-3-methyl-5-hydroxy-6-metoxy-1,4-benzoquinol methylase
MKCILCGDEKSFENVSHTDAKSSGQILVVICGNCGLVQQSPIPSTDELKVYYSHHYRKEYKDTYSPKSKHIYRAGKIAVQRINFLKEAGVLNGTLLDVGAGGGEFVYLAERLGFQAQGIEPNIGYSEYAKSEYGCNIMTLELEDVTNTYDIITIFHVLEHLPSPMRAFEKLYSLLNKNGKLFIEVPWIEANNASPNNIYFKAHIFYFSADTLISCASRFFNVLMVDTSSNLKILLEAKEEESTPVLPSTESVTRIKKRLADKNWFEYMFPGKGYLKPITKILRAIEESKANGIAPKAILDGFIPNCSFRGLFL